MKKSGSSKFREVTKRMKRLLHLGSANLVAALLATPAPAKRAQSNKGGATKGLERAEQVQTTNKADAHPRLYRGSWPRKGRRQARYQEDAQVGSQRELPIKDEASRRLTPPLRHMGLAAPFRSDLQLHCERFNDS